MPRDDVISPTPKKRNTTIRITRNNESKREKEKKQKIYFKDTKGSKLPHKGLFDCRVTLPQRVFFSLSLTEKLMIPQKSE